MLELLSRNWGWVVLRGAVGILFGVLTFVYPAVTLVTLVFLFGIYAIVDGVGMSVSAIANRRGQPRWVALLVGGLLGIAVGVATLLWPEITSVVLLALIATWAIITGLAEIVAAVQLRKELANEWLLVLAGVFGVAFGVLLVLNPAQGALAVVLLIGAYAVIYGSVLVAFGFKLRKWRTTHPTTAFAA
jgi:uncharacterized membrane protein HdeD (DUF308 family)